MFATILPRARLQAPLRSAVRGSALPQRWVLRSCASAAEENLPLKGVLVVALEQAMAAPFCTARLADAGARVIKLERNDGKGDMNRGYDNFIQYKDGYKDSAHSVWLNRGKESLSVDIKDPKDQELIHKLLAQADVWIQNMAPGATKRSGFGSDDLRKKYPKLITVDCSGYGNPEDAGSYWDMKAYDMLVQAESGISVLAGTPGRPTRCGVSLADMSLGMFSNSAVLEALVHVKKTGKGVGIDASLFGCLADWLTTSIFHYEKDGAGPAIGHGLRHPTIQPYRDYKTRGDPVLISVQNDREFAWLCKGVLDKPEFLEDKRFTSNVARCENSEALDKEIEKAFMAMDRDDLISKLKKQRIAFGQVSGMRGLSEHPALKRVPITCPNGDVVQTVAPPARFNGVSREMRKVPALGEHSEAIRAEFADAPVAPSDEAPADELVRKIAAMTPAEQRGVLDFIVKGQAMKELDDSEPTPERYQKLMQVARGAA